MNSSLFESHKPYILALNLKNRIAALLRRHVILVQTNYLDPSRRQQANFLRKKLEGEKFEKSESEEV